MVLTVNVQAQGTMSDAAIPKVTKALEVILFIRFLFTLIILHYFTAIFYAGLIEEYALDCNGLWPGMNTSILSYIAMPIKLLASLLLYPHLILFIQVMFTIFN